jgi:cytochrome bd ubiquinol oxidase subunit II
MSDLIHAIGLPEILAGIIVLALNAYALMGGADYGGGLWDLLATGPRRQRQRDLIASSIAPIWEANHVWLIVVVVMLFTAFPAAFSLLGVVLHVPITLMLVGIVLRGSAFVFRSYGQGEPRVQRRWGVLFAIASTITPLLLGIIVGAVASGAVAAAGARVASGATFADVYVQPWLAPFPVIVGLFALALFAFLAAIYLACAAPDDELRDDFRRRAIGAGLSVFVLAGAAILVGRAEAPRIATGITESSWALLLQVLTAVAAIAAFVALWKRQYQRARVAAAAQVSFILWGWAFAQFPFVIPDTLTIRAAAAPRITLVLLLVGLGIGALILLPSLRYLFSLFPGRASGTTNQGAHGGE